MTNPTDRQAKNLIMKGSRVIAAATWNGLGRWKECEPDNALIAANQGARVRFIMETTDKPQNCGYSELIAENEKLRALVSRARKRTDTRWHAEANEALGVREPELEIG